MPSGFPPVRKSLGQHFLTDQRVLERIAGAAMIAPNDTVIEIGPGRGALTDLLIEQAGKLIAIEYDRALAQQLKVRYATRTNIEIVQADVLTVQFGDLVDGKPFKLVGNVPYYITTPILFQALEQPRPELALYLVQREVADRLSASPGSREYGALTVNVGSVANVETLFTVPAGAFRPPPKVESAVVRVSPKAKPLVAPQDEEGFRSFVQSVFSMRRKQTQRILRSIWNLDQASADQRMTQLGIEGSARPETLTIEQFARLYATVPGSRPAAPER
jgi:16S rRNA (adenine1518-N6/adenine1519-N6)-dimethyltransferase